MKKAEKRKPEDLVTLKVGRETHKRIKDHCVDNNLWIHLFVEHVMNQYIDKQTKS
jgi:hypothetical protein